MKKERLLELSAFARKTATMKKSTIIDRIIEMLPKLTAGALAYILMTAQENIALQEQDIEE